MSHELSFDLIMISYLFARESSMKGPVF